jgi:hypothetical protein
MRRSAEGLLFRTERRRPNRLYHKLKVKSNCRSLVPDREIVAGSFFLRHLLTLAQEMKSKFDGGARQFKGDFSI